MVTLTNVRGSDLVPDISSGLRTAFQAFGTPATRAAAAQKLSSSQQTQDIQAETFELSKEDRQRAIDQQAKVDELLKSLFDPDAPPPQDAQKKVIKGLEFVQQINPDAAKLIQTVSDNNDPVEIDAVRQEAIKGLDFAKKLKSAPSFLERKKVLTANAARLSAEGKPLDKMIELSNKDEAGLLLEAEKMEIVGTGMLQGLPKPAPGMLSTAKKRAKFAQIAQANPALGKTLLEMNKQRLERGFTLSEGQTRFDAGGQPIAAVAAKVDEVETFTPVKDALGRIVGQRSSLTNKVVPDPRAAPKKGSKPKFENFVATDGGFVTIDTNSTEGAALAAELINGGGRKATATDAVPTVEQGKAAGFTLRAESATAIIDSLGEQFTDVLARGRVLPNFAKSADRQRFEQAERNLVNSILRRESGAVISAEEFDNARLQYIPQPGDSAEVVAQKGQNRLDIVAGLRAAAGKGALKSVREQRAALEPAKAVVNIGGQQVSVGEIIENASGQKARVEANGTLTPIQ